MRALAVVLTFALFLPACAGERPPDQAAAPDPQQATPPRDTGSAGGGEIIPAGTKVQALGNEPFWSVTVSPDRILYRDPEHPDGIAFPPDPGTATATGRTYRSVRPDSIPGTVVVTIAREPCSDGMSDERYEFASVVTLDRLVLKGCARVGARAR